MNLPSQLKVLGKKKNKIIKIQEEISTLQNRRLAVNPELENWETGKTEGVNWVYLQSKKNLEMDAVGYSLLI